MVAIRISGIKPIGVNPNKYELILDGKGKGGGHHIALDGNEEVKWEVQIPTSAAIKIASIEDIVPKSTSGSTDIFGTNVNNKPSRDGDPKKFKAKLNNVTVDAIYFYTIRFKVLGDTTIYEFDPIISIKPSNFSGFKSFLIGFFGLAGYILSAIIYRKMNLMEKKFMSKNEQANG